MLLDKNEGYLYPYNEPYMIAHYVMKLFDDIHLSEFISENARKKAVKLYSPEENFDTLNRIYRSIAKGRTT